MLWLTVALAALTVVHAIAVIPTIEAFFSPTPPALTAPAK
jgi:hypothetical protein